MSDHTPGGDMSAGPTPGPEGGLPPACAAVDADLAELALGALTGKSRVAALAHLEVCHRCAGEVEQLAAAADELLHLAPASEPPVGFEADVFKRLGLSPEPKRQWLGLSATSKWPAWSRLAAAAAVAAVVLVGAGAGLGVAVSGDKANNVSQPPSALIPGTHLVAFKQGSTTVGELMVYPGNPTWLFMYIKAPDWYGALRCEVVVDQGRTVSLGHFWLSGGEGAWAASTSQPAGRLSEALIVGQDGKVLARARLS